MMLGMGDWSVAAAYWLNIIAVIICVIYGAVNWNRGDDSLNDQDEDSKNKTEKSGEE
jgi:hypothetical protein